MDNFSGVQLSDAMQTYLSDLESELGTPIRIIDTASRAAVPDYETHDRVQTEWGYATTVLDASYGGFMWRDANHPEGMVESGTPVTPGLTILMRSTYSPFVQMARTASQLIIDGAVQANTQGRMMLDRLAANRETLLRVNQESDDQADWVEDLQVIPWPDWNGDNPPEMAAVFTMRSDTHGTRERCLAYPFPANRQRTANDRNNRVNRDRLWREPIEAALGNVEELRARMAEQARERFREFATGRIGARIRDVRAQVSQLEADVQLHQQALLDNTVRLREEKITLDMLVAQEQGEGHGIDADAEWQAIERHNMVDEFTIVGDRFEITTTPLELTDPDTGETAPLGRIRITFPMQPGSGRGIRIANLDYAMDDGSGTPRPHPHCPQGVPCFGSVMSEVARMGASGEVGGLLELLLQYLQTFNPRDDYGRYAGLWFEGEVREDRRR